MHQKEEKVVSQMRDELEGRGQKKRPQLNKHVSSQTSIISN